MGRFIARVFLNITGWQAEGAKPVPSKFVLIAAPHTSNWDLAYLLAFAAIFDIRISWMGKHVLFRPPLGWLMRALGGIPIVRHARGNMVSQMARAFEDNDSLALVVPAEGTRGYVPHWKSGFYHIARQADVPIVLGFLDFARRRGGFGPALYPTGDIRRDMDEIRDFYADKAGKYPDQFGEVRLKEEM
ncbi:MAG: lysophospholipid acyltransferase family protein [Deltaproteobacteria bacterium]|nr:MAG: lysophospholipid acyltransferase family protein [Deltaproteobacteria bacterium]